MPLQGIVRQYIAEYSLFSKILGLAILLLISFYINRLNTKYILIPDRTYLPATFYLLICCGLLSHKDLTATLIGMLFFLFSLDRMLDSYKNESLSYNSFDASLLIGIASLFYFNFIFFIIFIWFALSILRSFKWREWLYTIIGLSIPYFILLSIYYLLNIDSKFLFITIKENFVIQFPLIFNKVQYIFGSLTILILIISAFYTLTRLGSMKILARRTFNLFAILILICIAIFFIIKSTSVDIIFITAFPISMLFSNYFLSARRGRWLEILFDIFIVSFLLTQFLVIK